MRYINALPLPLPVYTNLGIRETRCEALLTGDKIRWYRGYPPWTDQSGPDQSPVGWVPYSLVTGNINPRHVSEASKRNHMTCQIISIVIKITCFPIIPVPWMNFVELPFIPSKPKQDHNGPQHFIHFASLRCIKLWWLILQLPSPRIKI